jgi:hypothetical protein
VFGNLIGLSTLEYIGNRRKAKYIAYNVESFLLQHTGTVAVQPEKSYPGHPLDELSFMFNYVQGELVPSFVVACFLDSHLTKTLLFLYVY